MAGVSEQPKSRIEWPTDFSPLSDKRVVRRIAREKGLAAVIDMLPPGHAHRVGWERARASGTFVTDTQWRFEHLMGDGKGTPGLDGAGAGAGSGDPRVLDGCHIPDMGCGRYRGINARNSLVAAGKQQTGARVVVQVPGWLYESIMLGIVGPIDSHIAREARELSGSKGTPGWQWSSERDAEKERERELLRYRAGIPGEVVPAAQFRRGHIRSGGLAAACSSLTVGMVVGALICMGSWMNGTEGERPYVEGGSGPEDGARGWAEVGGELGELGGGEGSQASWGAGAGNRWVPVWLNSWELDILDVYSAEVGVLDASAVLRTALMQGSGLPPECWKRGVVERPWDSWNRRWWQIDWHLVESALLLTGRMESRLWTGFANVWWQLLIELDPSEAQDRYAACTGIGSWTTQDPRFAGLDFSTDLRSGGAPRITHAFFNMVWHWAVRCNKAHTPDGRKMARKLCAFLERANVI